MKTFCVCCNTFSLMPIYKYKCINIKKVIILVKKQTNNYVKI